MLFVPGFGMNSFIFRFHPRGGSFMQRLLDAGLDPWSVDLRGHTSSKGRTGTEAPTLSGFAFVDLPATFDFIARTTGHDRVHAIGCSLGGALLYAYAGSVPDHRVDRIVSIGSPLRWIEKSPVVRAFARLSPFAPSASLRGTRRLARIALPIATALAPGAMGFYLNPELTWTKPVRELVRTLEDPHPLINAELAQWIRRGDLHLGDINVTEVLANVDRPLLVIVGAGDRICPPSAALVALDIARGPTASLLVGSEREPISHADLFISDVSPERVFQPVARYLTASDDP